MDLLTLADFNLVARHGGFGRAARAAGRPKATLSRRVAELEAGLGVRLFERGRRALVLTQEGHTLHERTGTLLAEIDEVAAAVASGATSVRGRLRVSAPQLFSLTAMGKLAAGFALRHPDVRLEVTSDDRVVDLVEEGYDMVIRVNPSPDESLVGRVFMRDRLVVVASPGLARPARNRPVRAIVRGTTNGEETGWNVKLRGGRSRIAIEPVLRLSSLVMVRDAVRTGLGAGCLPVSLVARDLAAGSLVQWAEVDGPEIALWALYASRRLLSPRVSAFLDHLKAAFPRGTPEELASCIDE